MGSETVEFAALLRELKDRSGRSYGALAGKLHMSTSTVHRYCNGDAVPTEYAPVERFARLCAATPDELVALHRRWLLADAARRRPKDGAGPEATVPEQRAAGRTVPEAVLPEAVVQHAVGPQPRSLSGASDPGSPSAAPTGPGPAVRSRRNTRLRLIGAAVVLAAVAVPVAMALRPDGASGAASVTERLPEHQRSHAASAGPSPRTSHSAPPSPSSTPSPSASRSARAGRAGGTTGDLGPDGDSVPAVPLTVNVRPYVWDDPCSQSYLVDRAAAKMPPPPAEQDAASWATALGGVSSGGARIELSVQGKTSDAVVLQALHVRIVGRHAPLAWSSYAMGDGCGGGIVPAGFDVNLDTGTPMAEPAAGVQGDRKVPATDFPYKVSSSDPQVLEIKASTAAHDVSWYLDLQWSSGDRHGTIRLDDHGKPFRASSVKGRPRYVHPLGGDTWEPAQQ
ncbi:helix-turn-helix domain-containing protein [Streptomyces sp. NBC_00859]|uniref:helix-turn-helix domain-containing protein n=1 Tax=Streptomyces sp. NBC_00859 TaxID=2903682 RepID=UPI003869A987|nr:helix-turn-helix domain-containing protein [Streptomyces sp. NBC_00859]